MFNTRHKYSAVIPVYNSALIVGDTIDRTVAFFETQGYDYEIILVNDGSRDASWQVIEEHAHTHPNVVGINLLRNYGQHTALLCGLQHSTGNYVITLDDDLQNPPEEIHHLIAKAGERHDVVFGKFRKKEHARYRRLGTLLIGSINKHIFDKPDGLVLSNFRLIRRDVVDRICAYRTSHPYIPGLILMFSSNPANAWVEHHKRPIGKSNYNLFRIAALVMRILFNYSSLPLRLVSAIGIIVALFSFFVGTFFTVRGVLGLANVPGWTSMFVLLSFLQGITLLIMGMLGEYLVRLINQTSQPASYQILEKVSLTMRDEVLSHA